MHHYFTKKTFSPTWKQKHLGCARTFLISTPSLQKSACLCPMPHTVWNIGWERTCNTQPNGWRVTQAVNRLNFLTGNLHTALQHSQLLTHRSAASLNTVKNHPLWLTLCPWDISYYEAWLKNPSHTFHGTAHPSRLIWLTVISVFAVKASHKNEYNFKKIALRLLTDFVAQNFL